MAPLWEGVRKGDTNDRHIKGKKQTRLFRSGENPVYPPPSAQAVSQMGDITWSPLIG